MKDEPDEPMLRDGRSGKTFDSFSVPIEIHLKMKSFNPLDHPIIFSTPARLTRYSFWQEHIPFGMLLVQLLKPALLVELGTHYGDSYCAFCQAVKELSLPARCYAVDNWQGDEHIPTYGSDVLTGLREHHDPRYSDFSCLVQSDFDAARDNFADGTIDLLHLDGTHTYEAVKHDFQTWLPKLSRRGVVLFHDTNVLDRDYGVRQFFDEIKQSYPHFEFLHGYGLGVLAVGPEQPETFLSLLKAGSEEQAVIKQLFFQLGQRLSQTTLLEQLLDDKKQLENLKDRFKDYQLEIAGLNYEKDVLQKQLVRREQAMSHTQSQLDLIIGSNGFALLQKYWDLRNRLRQGKLFADKPVEETQAEPDSARNGSENSQLAELNQITYSQLTVNEPVAVNLPEPALTSEMLEALNGGTLARLKRLSAPDLRLIAYYLPQFHPIPENDLWWGKGFTEWTNVPKARPNFAGHYQPHLPADLGYYDLRVPEVREHQAALAKEYGLHGFCYHHYWFGGKRLLERPLNEILQSGQPDFPFCICWANENWTRRWDGQEKEILMAQNHSEEDDRNFIRHLFPVFEDSRYIRVNGKPLLIVYRANILPEAVQTIERWREEARRAGLGELYLVAAQTFGIEDPRQYGFDAAVEFPPHNITADNLTDQVNKLNKDFTGLVFDYTATANGMIYKAVPDYKVIRTVMPGWDNTPRRQNQSHIFINSSPAAYEYWLGRIVESTVNSCQGDERLVFINAWNEWGEGAHLEPDRLYGHQYLEATRKIVQAAKGIYQQ